MQHTQNKEKQKIRNKAKIVRWFSAALGAAGISCTQTLPDIRAPVEVNRVIPATDIATDSQRILEVHNQIRRQLSIPELRWSNQMAVYATEWALYLSQDVGCQLHLRGAIGLPLHKNGIGENLLKRAAVVRTDGDRQLDTVDERSVVLEWASESLDFNYLTNECAVNKTCDHYTQVVWRDSVVVGCGAASCPNKDQIWVCNYDPPGNFLKQRPY